MTSTDNAPAARSAAGSEVAIGSADAILDETSDIESAVTEVFVDTAIAGSSFALVASVRVFDDTEAVRLSIGGHDVFLLPDEARQIASALMAVTS